MTAAQTEAEWIDWAGGECPVPGETKVGVVFPDGQTFVGDMAAFWSGGGEDWWRHESKNPMFHIVKYRVVVSQ